MITLNLKQKTEENGHLIIDVSTSLINKDVDILLIIQEKDETSLNDNEVPKTKKKYDFSHLYGKLEWQGNALDEQKKVRSEWR